MKKFLLFILAVLSVFVFVGCEYKTDYIPPKRPHLYWKDIDVVVIDVSKRHWYVSTHWYTVNVTVESEKYGLKQTFTFKGSGVFGRPLQWDYKEGDVIKAELYSWVMESTGEVTRREIHRIY